MIQKIAETVKSISTSNQRYRSIREIIRES